MVDDPMYLSLDYDLVVLATEFEKQKWILLFSVWNESVQRNITILKC